MKGFPGRRTILPEDQTIYNYRYYNFNLEFDIFILMLNCIISYNRHSRARRTSENLFGIMATRCRIFLTTINAKPENVEHYTRAVMVLHNMLIAETKDYSSSGQSDYFDRNGGLMDGE